MADNPAWGVGWQIADAGGRGRVRGAVRYFE